MSGVDKLIEVVANINTEMIANRKNINKLIDRANDDVETNKKLTNKVNELTKEVEELRGRLRYRKPNSIDL